MLDAGQSLWQAFDSASATVCGDSNRFIPDLTQYVEYIVLFSGGKDSIACVLQLLELGVDPSKIEVHHHLVDGKEGSRLMDWPVTASYCKKFAQAFGLRYVETWRQGGFEREMLRDTTATAPIMIPDENGVHQPIGGNGPVGTRRKFPQVSMDLQTRWCSGYLKVDVGARYFNNVARFADGQKRLVLSGERAEESAARAKYQVFEPHICAREGKRVVRQLDHWRAVHSWSEAEVWAIIERFGVNPHPSYKIGFSRCSCSACVFINNDSWATLQFIAPKQVSLIGDYEKKFGFTIHRELSVEQRCAKGTVYENADKYGPIGMCSEFLEPILINNWKLPAGAFQTNGGCF
jgi:3'-phosphoadenosine 5'-phosphosulfate sulfotransferase (PAPS reductase)/FAD synthetase